MVPVRPSGSADEPMSSSEAWEARHASEIVTDRFRPSSVTVGVTVSDIVATDSQPSFGLRYCVRSSWNSAAIRDVDDDLMPPGPVDDRQMVLERNDRRKVTCPSRRASRHQRLGQGP